jgi:myo-inositol 2-dehydrogenase/D-chiro-inositol 1-dehydrogenase
MSIGIGVIGTGVMGADHARTIATAVGGAHLAAVSDPDTARATQVAAETGAARVLADGRDVIAHAAVDAVLIASPDQTHAGLVLACLDAGKPVLCEKPLAATMEECQRIIAAEVALGRRLVQVGFMRRFDPAYADMKARLGAGEVGAAVMLHCVHRNATMPAWFDAEMVITNSAVHEIDIARWLLDEDIVRASVFVPRSARPGPVQDRLFMVLQTERGALVDVEVFLSAGYGYDVRAELVCEQGSLARAPRDPVVLRHNARQGTAVAADWRAHFAAAYRLQLQAWVHSIRSGHPAGASSWDGYAASATASACVRALRSGAPAPVELGSRPALYA